MLVQKFLNSALFSRIVVISSQAIITRSDNGQKDAGGNYSGN